LPVSDVLKIEKWSSGKGESDDTNFFYGKRTSNVEEFVGEGECLQCGAEVEWQKNLRRHVADFHSSVIYMCPCGHARHPLPIISHNEDWMRKHIKNGHKELVVTPNGYNKFSEKDFGAVMKPLPLNYELLKVPFLALERNVGYFDLIVRELKSPERIIAADYFRKVRIARGVVNYWLSPEELNGQQRASLNRETQKNDQVFIQQKI
jgi:hypothetical protein